LMQMVRIQYRPVISAERVGVHRASGAHWCNSKPSLAPVSNRDVADVEDKMFEDSGAPAPPLDSSVAPS
jgi:hypothetical protein